MESLRVRIVCFVFIITVQSLLDSNVCKGQGETSNGVPMQRQDNKRTIRATRDIEIFQPFFSNVRNSTRLDCHSCLIEWKGVESKIDCIVNNTGENNSDSIEMSMYLNDVKLNSTTKQSFGSELLALRYNRQIDGSEREFRCEVSGHGQTAAKVIVLSKPTDPVIQYTQPIYENKTVNVKCISTGVSFPPNISMTFSGRHFTPSSYTQPGEANFLLSFENTDNEKKLNCCSTYETFSDIRGTASICYESQPLSILYAPKHIEMQVEYKQRKPNGDTKMTIICDVGVSNPPSNVTFLGLDDVLIKSQNSTETPFSSMGSSMSTTIEIRLSRKDHGLEITCKADNDKFPNLNLYKTFRANITYKPIVSVPKELLTTYIREPVTLRCIADANPAPTLVWYRNGTEVLKQAFHDGSSTLYGLTLDVIFINGSDTGVYEFTCIAWNSVGSQQEVTTIVKVKEERRQRASKVKGSIMPTVVGVIAGLLVVLALVAVIVWIRKKQDKQQRGTLPDPRDPEERRPQSAQERPTDVELETDDPPEYAAVIPKADRQAPSPQEEVRNGGLIYADLNLSQSTSPPPVQTEPTEYVCIDHVKTAQHQQDDYTDADDKT